MYHIILESFFVSDQNEYLFVFFIQRRSRVMIRMKIGVRCAIMEEIYCAVTLAPKFSILTAMYQIYQISLEIGKIYT